MGRLIRDKEQAAKYDEDGAPIYLVRAEYEYDICECGDYRFQHEDWAGKCRMRDDLCHGFEPCLKFRLVREY